MEKYPGHNPYVYCYQNPIKFIDPTGMEGESIGVTKNNDGTYTVVSGKADGDKGIYVVDEKGNYNMNSEKIGESPTEYSFLDESGNAINGAIIDGLDASGINFLNLEILNNNSPNILSYMKNATGGEKYDFKTRGADPKLTDPERFKYYYRGMLFQGIDGFSQGADGGMTIFASARDFGNVAAGYVAGNNGLPWSAARGGFDTLESWQKKSLSSEGLPTKLAEKAGHNIGISQFRQRFKKADERRQKYFLSNPKY